MALYRVYMSSPKVWQVVEANDKDEAIEIATNQDNEWEGDIDYGGEEYEAFKINNKGHEKKIKRGR